MSEDIFVVNVNDDEYESVDILDIESDIDLDERVHVIEVEDSESRTVETFDAFNALGEPNEQLKHQLLNGRDTPDQHPITAITGLKDKLDDIEALKTVYSNEKQSADYYEWEDGNVIQENRVGLFVTLCRDINKIRVCTKSDDIFGVVVDAAGFIGGQSDLARDYTYGLVTTTGVVHVRCELDVVANDFVMPNSYGVAKKTHSNYGCKVVALHNINGLTYAAILLETSANQLYEAGEGIRELNDRVDNVEKNVTVAINAANEANKKIDDLDLDGFKGTVNDYINESSNRIEGIIQDNNERYDQQISDAIKNSEEAKAIANSTVASAESLRNEAVTKANEALEGIQTVKDEVAQDIANINTDIDNSNIELQKTKEDLEKAREELKDSIDGNIADFKKEIEDNYATTESLAAFKTDTTMAISSVKQEVSDTYATKTELTSFETETTDAITGVEERVDENSAQLTTLASFEYGNTIELRPFTNLYYETIDEVWSEEEKDITKKYYVSSEEKYYYYNNGWASTEKLSVDINGITFTDNNDGTITAGGTVNNVSSGFIDFVLVENKILANGEYEISGCPNGSQDTYYILLKIQNGETVSYKQILIQRGDPDIPEERFRKECRFTITNGDVVSIYIRIKSEFEISESGLEFNPQLKQYYSGISGLKNQVAKNGASIDMLSSFSSDNGVGAAGLIAKVSDHDSQLSTLASWKSEVANDDGTLKVAESIAAIKQQADAQGGTIQSVVTWQENLEVGGRNLVASSMLEKSVNGDSTQSFTASTWGAVFISTENLLKIMKPSTTYTVHYDVELIDKTTAPTPFSMDVGFKVYSPKTLTVIQNLCADQITSGAQVGDTTRGCVTFTAPDEIPDDCRVVVYTRRWTTNGNTPIGFDTVRFTNFKWEKGNVATDWSPAPEDAIDRIASIELDVSKNESSITSLTTGLSTTNDNVAKVTQQAGENGASINMLVTSVDKYSVGEYSQSHGLTYEQAKNILKVGTIYIPTKHNGNIDTHTEMFHPDYITISEWKIEDVADKDAAKIYYVTEDKLYRYYDVDIWKSADSYESAGIHQTNEFTASNSYEWDGTDWIESGSGTVAFSSDMPTPTNTCKYWYTDSSEGIPEGYESNALYIYQEEYGRWEQVALYSNNPNNRMVSMINQEKNKISLEVANTRGSVAAVEARVDDTETTVNSLAAWAKKENDGSEAGYYNIAAIEQTANDAGASVAQIAGTILTEYETLETISGSIMEPGKVYYIEDEKKFYFYDGEWKCTSSPTEAGLELNAAAIVAAINNTTGESTVKIDADHIIVDGSNISLKGQSININADNVLGIQSPYFSVNTNGYMTATGGNIGGWTIRNGYLTSSQTVDMGEYNLRATTSLRAVPEDFTKSYGIFGVQKQMILKNNESTLYAHLALLIDSEGRLYAGDGDGNRVVLYEGYIQFFMNMFTETPQWCGSLSPYSGNGILFNGNNKKIYGELTDGRSVEMIHINNSNQMVIGQEHSALQGVEIYHGATYKSTLFNSLGIEFQNNGMHLRGKDTNGVSQHIISILNTNNLQIGTTNLAGNVDIYVKSGQSTNFYNGSSAICSVLSGALKLHGTNGITIDDNYYVLRYANSQVQLGTSVYNTGVYGSNVNIRAKSGQSTNFYNGGNAVCSMSSGAIDFYNSGSKVCSIYSNNLNLKGQHNGITMGANATYILEYNDTEIDVGTSSRLLNLYGNGVLCNGKGLSYSSDKRLKNSINDLSDKYIDMIDLLSAKSYKYNEQTDDVINCGFVAQDVLSALNKLGLTQEEFGGVLDVYKDGSKYALDYMQFIPILWENVRKLKKQVKELEIKLEEKGE